MKILILSISVCEESFLNHLMPFRKINNGQILAAKTKVKMVKSFFDYIKCSLKGMLSTCSHVSGSNHPAVLPYQ